MDTVEHYKWVIYEVMVGIGDSMKGILQHKMNCNNEIPFG